MSTVLYCSKQAAAMAEFATEHAKSKLDAAIDVEESREEMIAARAREIQASRLLAMAPIDVVAGLQSVMEEGSAPMIARMMLAGDMEAVGLLVRAAVHAYIRDDSEIMANDWMDRIDLEISAWGQ